jgi:hypothetical protein
MDDEFWWVRAKKSLAEIRKKEIKRYTEIAESLSEKHPELSRAVKDLIPKGVIIGKTKDNSIIIDSPADVFEEGYYIKFKCRERTCIVRGFLETAIPTDTFREEMRSYGCKILGTEIYKEEYGIANVRVRCLMSVDKLVEFIDKVLKRYP